ncbi:hypothetical protein L9F63_018233, partial [Diploptera punctata]
AHYFEDLCEMEYTLSEHRDMVKQMVMHAKLNACRPITIRTFAMVEETFQGFRSDRFRLHQDDFVLHYIITFRSHLIGVSHPGRSFERK